MNSLRQRDQSPSTRNARTGKILLERCIAYSLGIEDENYEWHLRTRTRSVERKETNWSISSPCIMSFGFIVSLRLFEILCIVTIRPAPFVAPRDDPLEIVDGNESSRMRYGLCGKAKRKAIAAKHISIQMKKFCQPVRHQWGRKENRWKRTFTRCDRSDAQIRLALKRLNHAEVFENRQQNS